MSEKSAWIIEEFSPAENFAEINWLAPERKRLADFWSEQDGTQVGEEYGMNPSPRSMEATFAYMSDPCFRMLFVRHPDDKFRLIGKFDMFEGRLPLVFNHGDGEFWEGQEGYDARFNSNGRTFGVGVNWYYPEVDQAWLDRGIGSALVERAHTRTYPSHFTHASIDLATDPEVKRVMHLFRKLTPTDIIVTQAEPRKEWQVWALPLNGHEFVMNDRKQATGASLP